MFVSLKKYVKSIKYKSITIVPGIDKNFYDEPIFLIDMEDDYVC